MKTIEITIKFELTEEELELLKKAKEKGYLEYRDTHAYTYEQYVEDSKEYFDTIPEKSRFNLRNENGTLKIAESLMEKTLLDFDDMAWQYTLRLTDVGEMILDQN